MTAPTPPDLSQQGRDAWARGLLIGLATGAGFILGILHFSGTLTDWRHGIFSIAFLGCAAALYYIERLMRTSRGEQA